MKYNDELTIPKDLGISILRSLKPTELFAASLVCKSWNTLFSNENLWRQKLLERGFSNLECLKNVMSVTTYKDLYKLLASDVQLFKLFQTMHTDKKLIPVEITPSFMKKIQYGLNLVEPGLHEDERKNRQCSFLYRCGISVYSSMSQYIDKHFIKEKYLASLPITFTSNFDSITINQGRLEPILFNLCNGDDSLLSSLRNICQENLIVSLHSILTSLKGHNLVGIGGKTKWITSLIPNNKGTVYFTCSTKSYLSDYDSLTQRKDDLMGINDTNVHCNFVVEITPHTTILHDYQLLVSEDLHSIFSSCFNDDQMLDDFLIKTGFEPFTSNSP